MGNWSTGPTAQGPSRRSPRAPPSRSAIKAVARLGLPLRFTAPQSHQDIQPLPALPAGDLSATEPQLCALQQDAFTGEIEIGNITGLMQSLRNVPRCRECLDDRLMELEQLFVGDMFEKRRAHFSGEIERGAGNARLGFCKSPGSHPLSEREIK